MDLKISYVNYWEKMGQSKFSKILIFDFLKIFPKIA